MSWLELKRRALLGASAAGAQPHGEPSSPHDPVEALLAELAESWLWCQGARLAAPLDGPQLALSCPPAPPQELSIVASDQILRALLYDGSARSAELTAQQRLGLSYYLASLAHHQRTLGLTLITPVLEQLLAPIVSPHESAQELDQRLALPLSALLSSIGARGRWLMERDPQWAPLLHKALSQFTECHSRRRLPDELEACLRALSEAQAQDVHAALPPSELEQLLIMSHPSSLRDALRDERVKALFKRYGLDLRPWLKLVQRSLPEQIDAECRS